MTTHADERSTFYGMVARTEQPVGPYAAMRKLLHTHPFHELFLCTRRGWQITAHGMMPLQVNDLFFFPAGHPHIAVSERHDACTALVLYLPEQFFSPYVEGDRDIRQIVAAMGEAVERGDYQFRLTEHGTTALREHLQRLVDEMQRRAPGYKAAAKSAAQSAFLTIMRACISPQLSPVLGSSNTRARLAEALCYLQTQYMHRITVEQMLEITSLGRSQFHALFKEETGRTLTQYVNALRLDNALRLLHDPEATITEIAVRCGFATVNYFTRVFTRQYGCSPRTYRRGALHLVASAPSTASSAR